MTRSYEKPRIPTLNQRAAGSSPAAPTTAKSSTYWPKSSLSQSAMMTWGIIGASSPARHTRTEQGQAGAACLRKQRQDAMLGSHPVRASGCHPLSSPIAMV